MHDSSEISASVLKAVTTAASETSSPPESLGLPISKKIWIQKYAGCVFITKKSLCAHENERFRLQRPFQRPEPMWKWVASGDRDSFWMETRDGGACRPLRETK